MDDLRRRLTAAAETGGREAALDALRCAAAWAVGELERGEPDAAPDAALADVIRLDDALAELAGLSRVVPALVAAAEAGPGVAEYLRERDADLVALRASVITVRAEREALSEREAEFRATLAGHAELADQVRELRRAERLTGALAELAGQRAAIERRLAEIGGPVAAAESGLHAASEQLLRLAEERRSALAPRLREALERAARAEAALRAEEEELARAEAAAETALARHAELVDLRERRIETARAHVRADREIAAALTSPAGGPSGAERARTLLDAIEDRLREVDAALTAALAEHDARASRPRLPWSDDTARARG